MAEGIDAIYDPSDVSYQMAIFRKNLQDLEESRARKTRSRANISANLWKMWEGEQDIKAKELISTGDYQLNPDKNFITRRLAPSGGRVIPTEKALLKKDFVDIRGPKTIPESISKAVSPAKKYTETKAFDAYTDIKTADVPSLEGATKATGSQLGKVVSGIGVGLSAYDLATNWGKKSKADKGLGIAKTALGGLSLINPAFGIYALGAGILDEIF